MLTVLVADDEFAVLEVLSMALEGEGHRVLKAGDGADALRILSGQPCDVIVCDENMPVMNGHQLIAAVRAEPKLDGTPIILMADTLGRPLPEIDGTVVLGKPILLSELFSHVERLGNSKARRKL
ncbi:MAG TPA: response regulator [Kofleriaceae bacterium]|nr:response regulator [Kofleriaceae bacterium]